MSNPFVRIVLSVWPNGGDDERGANDEGNNDVWSTEVASAGLTPL